MIRASTYGRGMWESPLFCPTVVPQYTLPTSPLDYYEAEVIESSSTIATGRIVAYRGQDRITLTSGFKTVLGAIFSAANYNCDPFIAGLVTNPIEAVESLSVSDNKVFENSTPNFEDIIDFKVYPSIVNSSMITVECTLAKESIASLYIYNSMGRLMRTISYKDKITSSVSSTNIDVSNLPNELAIKKWTKR